MSPLRRAFGRRYGLCASRETNITFVAVAACRELAVCGDKRLIGNEGLSVRDQAYSTQFAVECVCSEFRVREIRDELAVQIAETMRAQFSVVVRLIEMAAEISAELRARSRRRSESLGIGCMKASGLRPLDSVTTASPTGAFAEHRDCFGQ